MTTLHRVPVNWAGPQVVGLAVNVLHYSASDNVAPPVAAMRAAYQGLASLLPSGVTISFPTAGDTIDDTTGELVGSWSAAAVADVVGTGQATAAAGAGACVGWQTGGIVNGRRLRGRTFIVPVTSFAYDGGGHFGAATITQLDNFAAALQAAGPLAIWHRPTKLAPASGNSYGVVSHKVRNKVAMLRSRRD